jgi:hypothetical protein
MAILRPDTWQSIYLSVGMTVGFPFCPEQDVQKKSEDFPFRRIADFRDSLRAHQHLCKLMILFPGQYPLDQFHGIETVVISRRPMIRGDQQLSEIFYPD